MPHTHDIAYENGFVRKTYVHWDDDEPAREWAALAWLKEHAPGLAPNPVVQELHAGRPSIVMSQVPGEPLQEPLTAAQSEALTHALRQLFALPVPPDLRVRGNAPDTFVPRFHAWLTEEYQWDQCADPALVREAVAAADAWAAQQDVAAPWLVDPVLALGDGNLDNVLWDGVQCRLIDWEEYGVSDLAYELADVVEHISSRLGRWLDVEPFLAAFHLTDGQRERCEQHRRMFACFWLGMLLPGNGGWRRNPPGSTELQAHHVLQMLAR